MRYVRKGRPRICANPKCRETFLVQFGRNDGDSARGLCPKCHDLCVRRDGAALDPELYAECQRINAIEPSMRKYCGMKPAKYAAAVEAANIADTKKLGRERVNVLKALSYLSDGYDAGASTGKKGGPSGKER